MRFLWLRFLVIAALIVPLSGCPGAANIVVGTWLFTIKNGNSDSFALAFEQLANGQLQAPNPVPEIAADAVEMGGTWNQNGSTYAMRETKIGEDWLYTGTVHSSTSMSGFWAQDDNPSLPLGVWAAVFLPQ